MFAGEGDAFRTNERFKYLVRARRGQAAVHGLSIRSPSMASTPHERPDIYGKVGNSGVSIATLDDMKVLV